MGNLLDKILLVEQTSILIPSAIVPLSSVNDNRTFRSNDFADESVEVEVLHPFDVLVVVKVSL